MHDRGVDHHVVVEELRRAGGVRHDAADGAGHEEHVFGPVRLEPVVDRAPGRAGRAARGSRSSTFVYPAAASRRSTAEPTRPRWPATKILASVGIGSTGTSQASATDASPGSSAVDPPCRLRSAAATGPRSPGATDCGTQRRPGGSRPPTRGASRGAPPRTPALLRGPRATSSPCATHTTSEPYAAATCAAAARLSSPAPARVRPAGAGAPGADGAARSRPEPGRTGRTAGASDAKRRPRHVRRTDRGIEPDRHRARRMRIANSASSLTADVLGVAADRARASSVRYAPR